MMSRTVLYMLMFWALQIVAQVLFKWGSGSPSRWMWGFIGGNLFGLCSIWLLMLIYKKMNPNLALAIGGGGAFLLSQIFLALLFKSSLTPLQWVGITAIMIGMMLMVGIAETKASRGAQPPVPPYSGPAARFPQG